MFSKHLPPSADLPRVLALDERAAANLPTEIDLAPPPGGDSSLEQFDAIVGYTEPDPTLDNLESFYSLLRPGGRLILAAQAEPKALLEALVQSGYRHCLVERSDDWTLYRGERPPQPIGLADLSVVLNEQLPQISSPFYFIPVTQTPNKPAWRLAPDEKLHWQAPTVLDPESGQEQLLVFSSLLKAVAFMQRAVLANKIKDINKVGKFTNAVVKSWRRSFLLNPTFHDARQRVLGPAVEVDPQVALTGEE